MKPKQAMQIGPVLLSTLRAARQAETAGQLEQRDAYAVELFTKVHNGRLVTDGVVTVDTFWDIKTRSFITQTRKDGYVLLPAVYSFKGNAPVAHLQALYLLIPDLS